MGELDLNNASASDLTTAMNKDSTVFYKVDTASVDGTSGLKKTEWTNEKYSQYYGYYTTIPEIQAQIDAKATWTIGKGFTADPKTTMLLDAIKGNGMDSFNSILENCVRVNHIGGDSFCEIVRNKEEEFVNLIPLDPETMKIVIDEKGMIDEYVQTIKGSGAETKFSPDEIFHLARNRVASQMHGTSMIKAVENIILFMNRAMADYDRVLHRNVEPMMIYHLDTDDPTKIAAFKAKVDAAKGKGENIYIPKDAVVPEQIALSANSTMNPIQWLEFLTARFAQVTGVPDIITGGSKNFTDGASKMQYLAWQQTVEEEQLFIEEQLLAQLNVEIELTFPASIQNELVSDREKEGEETAAEPNDVTAETEGKT